jgi:hypothetical protein
MANPTPKPSENATTNVIESSIVDNAPEPLTVADGTAQQVDPATVVFMKASFSAATDVRNLVAELLVVALHPVWWWLDERIEAVTDEIEALAKSDDSCRGSDRTGIGPIISSAME